jgi:3-hydroxybutyryl-CoA dehydratase
MVSFELAVAGLATTCLWRLSGGQYRIASLNIDFPAPVPVGGTVEAMAEVLATDGNTIRCKVTCVLDQGGPVVVGEAKLVRYGEKA